MVDHGLRAGFSIARKRWRLAYAIVYTTRALVSTKGKYVTKLLHSASYPLINVDANRLSGDGQLSLTVLEETKNIDDLQLLGGVEGIVSTLEIDAEKAEAQKSAIPCSTRAILSLATGDCLTKCLRSPSYTLIDVELDRFSIINQSSSSLANLAEARNVDQLQSFGGVEGLVTALETDADKGIQGSVEDIVSRREAFGSNTFSKPPTKAMQVMFQAFKDPIILILLVCATLSIGFGTKKSGIKGFIDGGSILVSVILVVMVSALSNFWPKRHFNKLSRAGDCKKTLVEVVRNGQNEHITIFDVVVGDVVCLTKGHQVPADGLLIEGNLQVDGSILTDGSGGLVEVNCSQNPFLLSGTEVAEGCAQMLVTSVGMNTTWGRMMSSKSCDYNEKTPLQAKLHKLTLFIAEVGMAVASLVLVVLLIRYFTGKMYNDDGKREFSSKTSFIHVFDAVIGMLATAVAIAATAIPEGLLLAVAITFAYSTMRMAGDQALVRNLSAYEAIGSATVICTNKKGTLTLNQMKVIKFCLGHKYINECTFPDIAENVRELFCEGVGIKRHEVLSEPLDELSKNQTEEAIYDWGVQKMNMNIDKLKEGFTTLKFEAFDSETKQGGALIRKETNKTIHLHKKGAPDVILAMCSNYWEDSGIIKAIDEGIREKLEDNIQEMTDDGLQCIAFAHKQMSDDNDDEDFHLKLKEESLTLLGLVGMKNPCRPEVRKAVIDCQRAGVNIKMITGDDVPTARASAIECGIIEPSHDINTREVIEGVEFRNYTPEERMEKADKICVIARASTFDKSLMVKCLQQKGHVVAVTGDSKGDAQVLKEADIGLCLGIQGTDIAKENSDIVILDDSFVSVATVLSWGRGMYNNIQIFSQFQLTASIASLVIDFVTAIFAGEPPTINLVAEISAGEIRFATLQVLWVKLIVGTLASLAITIEKPAAELMQQPPINRAEPFITNIMWRNIVGQALYQITILLTIQFKGKSIFHVNAKVKDTLIFNIFVLCQICNIFNIRKFEKNVFKGLQRKKLFWGIIGSTILLQVFMVELLNRFADTEKLNLGQWGACVGIAVVSWPIGWLVKCMPVPTKPFSSYLNRQN